MRKIRRLKRFATLVGDAQLPVKRHAHNRPIQATVYVGTEHTDPRHEMGGATMCSSITLTVLPDGTWDVSVRERLAGRRVAPKTRVVASGSFDPDGKAS